MCQVCKKEVNHATIELQLCTDVDQQQLFELDLSNLRKLDCYHCKHIRTLPVISSLKKLNCDGCYSLQSIPRLPNLEILDCIFCGELQTLPHFPNLKELTCGWCDKLSEIPFLPKLQDLYCFDCPNLQTIPLLPNLEILDCDSCPSLKYGDLYKRCWTSIQFVRGMIVLSREWQKRSKRQIRNGFLILPQELKDLIK